MKRLLLLIVLAGISLTVSVIVSSPSAPGPVMPIAAADSKCHVSQINPTDPQAYNPDPNCTPGSLNPAVTQDTLAATICVNGYTKTIRPPVSYTNNLKKEQILAYGYFDTDLKSYEEDHLISLELGGNPSDPKNLWPEPHASLNEKDKVENYLHEQVCSGRMTLAEAQQKIARNWYEVYLQLYPPPLSEVVNNFIWVNFGKK